MFIQADNIIKDSQLKTDVCIIGAGAAGITMALELDGTGLSVLILESGDFKEDKRTQNLYDLETSDLPLSEPSRARQYGGSTTVWAGRWKAHDPIDFVPRSWVPNSGWPISFEELLPHYHRAAELLEAPDVDTFGLDSLEYLVNKGNQPLINNEQIESSVFHWLKQKDWDWGKKFKETIKASANITAVLRANATKLAAKNSNEINYVQVETLSGNKFQVKAQQFVLAAGGLENARLLLLSDGLGNKHDRVGRYYMDHPKGVVGEVRPYNKKTYLPAYWGAATEEQGFTRAGLKLSHTVQEQHQVLNSYVLLEPVFPWSYNPGLSAVVGLAQALKRRQIPNDIITQYVAAMAKNQKAILSWLSSKVMQRMLNRQAKIQKITLWNFMEQIPDPENRVTLGEAKDELGCNKIKLNWSINDLDKKTMIVMHQQLQEQFKQAGIGELNSPLLSSEYNEWPINNDASHHMGTTRMGQDVKTSVVDSNCKLHDQANVYIAGSSVFPTSGYANPTYTICALATRLAGHLKSKTSPLFPTTQLRQDMGVVKLVDKDVSGQKKVLIVGAGKRVQSAVLPALLCLKDQFEIAGIVSKKQKSLSLCQGKWQTTTHTSYDYFDFSNIDLIVVAVPMPAVGSVFKMLSKHNTEHITVMVDTPVAPLSRPGVMKYFSNFKEVRVSEDTIALPPFKLAKKLIAEGRIGKLKRIEFIHSGYRYHALASLKYLTSQKFIKSSFMKNLGEGKRLRQVNFAKGVKAEIIEPRDYGRGKFVIHGTQGVITDDEKVENGNRYLVSYEVKNNLYSSLKLNGEIVKSEELDIKYKENICSDVAEPSLMNSMKIRGLMELLNDVYNDTREYFYSPLAGYQDLLNCVVTEKLKRFYDFSFGSKESLWKIIIEKFLKFIPL